MTEIYEDDNEDDVCPDCGEVIDDDGQCACDDYDDDECLECGAIVDSDGYCDCDEICVECDSPIEDGVCNCEDEDENEDED